MLRRVQQRSRLRIGQGLCVWLFCLGGILSTHCSASVGAGVPEVHRVASASVSGSSAAGADLDARAVARADFRAGRYEQALTTLHKERQRASARGDTQALAATYADLGVVQRRLGKPTEALDSFERALTLYRNGGDRSGAAAVLTHMALIRLNQNLPAVALEMLRESLGLQNDGAAAEVERTYHYLSLLYASLHDFTTARGYLEQGLEHARSTGDPSRELPLLGSLGRLANLQNAHEEALAHSDAARRLAERLGDPAGVAYSLLESGRARIGLGRFSEAEADLRAGARIAAQLGAEGVLAHFDLQLAVGVAAQGRDTEALGLLEDAIGSLEDAGEQAQLLTAYSTMVPLLERQGRLAEALEASRRSLALQEMVSGLEASRRIAVMESTLRLADAERKFELLRRDSEIQALQLKQTRSTGLLAVATAGCLLLLSLLLAARYRHSRRLSRHLAAVATRDPLTGVGNRRAFDRALQRAWAAACGRQIEVAVLILDLDHFKTINDRGGHAAGDVALCKVAERLAGTIPADAVLARWGGEEFAILLVGPEAGEAVRLAEALRVQVQALRADGGPAVTVSIGVAQAAPHRDASPQMLIGRADVALYKAKAEGRNRVCAADPGDAHRAMDSTGPTHSAFA